MVDIINRDIQLSIKFIENVDNKQKNGNVRVKRGTSLRLH